MFRWYSCSIKKKLSQRQLNDSQVPYSKLVNLQIISSRSTKDPVHTLRDYFLFCLFMLVNVTSAWKHRESKESVMITFLSVLLNTALVKQIIVHSSVGE
jgi:hypothetical protein